MLMKDKTTKITRYYVGEEFYVDVVEHIGAFEAWLGNEGFGVTRLMFGVAKTPSMDEDEFLQTVEANIPEYKESYMEEVDN